MRDFRVANGATELLFVRHGEAQHPREPLGGDPRDLDLPLSTRGERQCAAVAQRLARREIGALYSSPLLRTRQTAGILADAIGLPVVEDARLREVEIAGAGAIGLHDLAEIAIARGGWSHLDGTEGSAAIRARMVAAVDDIVAAHAGARVVVVSHAGAINAYVATLLGLRADFFFPAGNTSITAIRASGARRLVTTLNDIAHLERMT